MSSGKIRVECAECEEYKTDAAIKTSCTNIFSACVQ